MINKNIKELIQKDALFVLNHSGGKDSQAMFLYLKQYIPPQQLMIVHAELPGVDWPGTITHIQNTTAGYGLKIVRARKTFFEMVKHRGMWPSPQFRQCTSDLKRSPIEKAIRQALAEQGRDMVVNCMGIRAEESSARAKAITFKLNRRNSKAGRTWFDWLPIHGLSATEVFARIREAGEDLHWAYKNGMSRLSCCFCIMASKQDLSTAANLQPQLFREYVEMEKGIDHTLIMPAKSRRTFLPEIISNQNRPC